ncbi:hypothetical protein CSKR_100178, partial [Clonorchis sinensis]
TYVYQVFYAVLPSAVSLKKEYIILAKYAHLQIDLISTAESLFSDVIQLNAVQFVFKLARYSRYPAVSRTDDVSSSLVLTFSNSPWTTREHQCILGKYTNLQTNLVLRETHLEPS